MTTSNVILISGCSSGIGRTLAMQLHERGHKVFAGGRRWESVKTLQDLGITPVELDVTSSEQCNEAVQTVLDKAGRLDVLINNAGVGVMGPLIDLDDKQIEDQLSVNVHSILRMTRAAAQPMIERRNGLIVNIGSVSGVLMTPFSGIYGASKAAVHLLSDALRMELSPFNINVMTVQPGAIESNFGQNAAHSLHGRHHRKSWYTPIEEAINARAKASQDAPTPTDEFCKALIETLETSPSTPLFRYGYGSRALPFFAQWVPTRLRDWVLMRRFQLHKLK